MLDVMVPLSLGTSVVALSAGGAYFCSERLRQALSPDVSQTFLSDSLDFSEVHEDGKTLIGREGSLTRTYHLAGIDYGLCREEEIQQHLKRRLLFLDEVVSKEGLVLRVITHRTPVSTSFEGSYENPYLQRLHDTWQSQFQKTFRASHYVVVSWSPSKGSSLKKGTFDDLCERVEVSLESFSPQTLRSEAGPHSPLLSFWGSLVNGQDTQVACTKRHLAERLVRTHIEFEWKAGRIHFYDGVKRREGAILSTQFWGDETSSNLFRDLSRLKGEVTFLHLIEGLSKQKALLLIREKEKEGSGIFSGLSDKAAQELETARQILQDGEGSLHSYQFSCVLVAESEEALKKLLKEAQGIFLSYGAQCALETQALEYVWRSQFPGHNVFVRRTTLLSQNISHTLTFDKDPEGTQNSDWGNGPLRTFKTINGSSFPLNLHVSEANEAVGHTLVIAPTGSGKTMLAQHLVAGALRHPELRVYMFDRLNGTRIFTEACGGEYIDISKDSGVKLNPFLGEDTPSNRAKLRRLLKLMTGLEEVNAQELNGIVDMVLNLEPTRRVLRHIAPSLLRRNGTLSEALQEWSGGAHAHWFNGEDKGQAQDALDLESRRLVGFEMTDILSQQEIVGPLVYYIMERILSVIRSHACPSWILIDESAPMLSVPFFRQYVEMLLMELRKLRGVVTLCFQDATSLQNTGIAPIILGQCHTKLIFPNPAAKREDYKGFELTDSEWSYIKGQNKAASRFERTVLVKKLKESAILDIDLRSLGSLMRLYLSGKDRVLQAKALQQSGGETWVDQYLSL